MSVEKIKAHFRNNKRRYLGGLGVLGAIGGAYYLGARQGNDLQVKVLLSPRSEVNILNVELSERSTPSKPVHLVGTNLYFPSLSEAARQTGHPLATISKQVNGHIPDVHGDVFQLLDTAG